MTSLLLVIIYMAFISLGLPDSTLGSVWPKMYMDLNVSVSALGIVTFIISAGTVVSSLLSDRIIGKLGTGLVTSLSVAMTAFGLFGFGISSRLWMLCLFAIPYGLGAGSVDVALNNYVALHYKSRHMSWLHCFWGVGASLGPVIMSLCLTNGLNWKQGFMSLGGIQTALVIVLFVSLPLWKIATTRFTGTELVSEASETGNVEHISIFKILAIPGAKYMLIGFFCYCATEATAGLWASTYLVGYRGLDAVVAAKWASLFYIGITVGRFICGFIADRFGDKNMVRLGQGIMIIAALIILFPLPNMATLVGLIMIGLGHAPIYPSLIHETPDNFGPEKSRAIIGVQMAVAYIGTTLMPPLFGILAKQVSLYIFPIYIGVIIVIEIVMIELLNKKMAKNK